MEADAETLFDYLGKRYEDAFADSPNLHRFISQAAKRLPAQSKVLDVGCGTGKPVAQVLQFAGHDVHGIDISQEMVNIASSQVKGQFQKADMRKYQPSSPFDGIFVILSLFQITPGETYSMAFKWSEWLKRDGILAIGVTPSTSLPADECTYDATWDCSRQIGKPWMDKYTNETFFSEDRWQEILRCAGFEIETSVIYSFTPNDPEHQSAETHYLVLARKVEAQPLLGPYSLSSYSLPSENSTQVDVSPHNFFSSRLVSEDLKKLLNALRTDQRVISLGSLPQGESSKLNAFGDRLLMKRWKQVAILKILGSNFMMVLLNHSHFHPAFSMWFWLRGGLAMLVMWRLRFERWFG